jgi:hypothetical protein
MVEAPPKELIGSQRKSTTAVQKRKRTAGRTPELTVEIGRIIVEAIAAGNFPSTSARIAGISPGTLTKWLERGEKGEQPYADFHEAFIRAEGKCESEAIQKLRNSDDWRGPEKFLSKRFRDSGWGDRDVLGQGGVMQAFSININVGSEREGPSCTAQHSHGIDCLAQKVIDVTPQSPVRNDPDPNLN